MTENYEYTHENVGTVPTVLGIILWLAKYPVYLTSEPRPCVSIFYLLPSNGRG